MAGLYPTEERILRKVIRAAKSRGMTLVRVAMGTCYGGEELAVKGHAARDAQPTLVDAIGERQAIDYASDFEDAVFEFSKDGHTSWFLFIFGNGSDGEDVIADYGCNPDTDAIFNVVLASEGL